MFKSQLQEYSQKTGLEPPVYEFAKEGPSHEPRFKAFVTVKGVKYESPPGFLTLKKAEHAAAKNALEGLGKVLTGVAALNPIEESGLCKNLLQEYAQKSSLPLPVYCTVRSAQGFYISTVEVAGKAYRGHPGKVKKEAEIKAAKFALLSIYTENHASTQDIEEGSWRSSTLQVESEKKRKRASSPHLLEPVTKLANPEQDIEATKEC